MDYLTFTDRETYLKLRTEWRIRYAELSKTIRELKCERAESSRSGDGSTAQFMVWKMKGTATKMLLIRVEMKLLAGQQRAENTISREAA